MAEAFVQVTEGSGKKLRTYERTIGANDVHEEIVLLGEPYLPAYVVRASDIPVASTSFRCLTLNAGASLNVRVYRIQIHQKALAGAAARMAFRIRRLSTAGSGGTALTPEPMDPGDAASGATAMQEATGGTVGNILFDLPMWLMAAASAGEPIVAFEAGPSRKPIIIPAGTSNGIVIDTGLPGVATATVGMSVWFTEAGF